MTTGRARQRARRGEGDRLREEIVEAAEALLVATASEDDVSIRAVADAVGVTAPSIYRHFPDKSHLLFEVCARAFRQLARHLEQVPPSDDPFEALDHIGRAYIRFGVEHPEHYRIMFMGREDLTPEEYVTELLGGGSAFGMLLVTVERMAASGRVRTELLADGPFGLALVLWAQVHGLTSLLVAKPHAPWPDTDRLIDRHVRLIVHGTLADPG